MGKYIASPIAHLTQLFVRHLLEESSNTPRQASSAIHACHATCNSAAANKLVALIV